MLSDGSMIFVADGNGIVHAVRASDGTLAWQAQLGPAITTDVIVSPNDLWLFVGTTSNLLFSINTATGNDCPLSHSTHALWVQSLSLGGGSLVVAVIGRSCGMVV